MTYDLNDAAAERGVIAGIFKFGGDAYYDIADLITTNTFSFQINQVLWKCCCHIFKEEKDAKLDIPSLMSAAQEINCEDLLESEQDKKYIRAMLNTQVDLGNVRKFAAKIRKLEIIRLAAETLDETKRTILSCKGDESFDHIISSLETPIFEFVEKITNVGSQGPVKMGGDILEYIDFLINNPRNTVGVSSGWKQYDRALGGGLRDGTINMIGARPKQGKSVAGDNIGLFVSEYEAIPVLNCDTEMSKLDHNNRCLAALSKVKIEEIEKGIFGQDPDKRRRVIEAGEKLKNLPYYYENVVGKPFEEIISIMRRWVHKTVGTDDNGKTKRCLIIYDYFKIMDEEEINGNMAEHQKLGFMMMNLHNFAAKYQVPILSLYQLNRDGINKEDTSIVSGSDRILMYCSNFTIFKPKSDDEIAEVGKEMGTHKLVPLICRHGPGLPRGEHINMDMQGDIALIKENETKKQKLEFDIDGGPSNDDIPF